MSASLASLIGLVLLAPAFAGAEENYEAKQVARAMKALALEPELAPAGKTIDHIHVVRYEVFLADEPFFTFPNMFHWLTHEDVVRREVLLAAGNPYDVEKVLETARNLRGKRIFAVVSAVPVKSREPGKVGLLVVTRDLWSLRLEWNLQFTGDQVDQLLLQLTERNLFGRNKRATVRTLIQPITWSAGESYVDQRLLGEKLWLEQSADFFFERADDSFDGFDAQVNLSRPFYDLNQRWGFSVPFRIRQRVDRQVQQGQVLTYDDPDTVEEEAIARTWDSRFLRLSARGRLQFPGPFTQRLAFGGGFSRLDAEPNADTRLPAANTASFERDVLPRSLAQAFPLVGWSGFTRSYRTFEGLSSYGVSEDVRLGPAVSLTITTPLEALGSSADAFEVFASAAWALDYAGDGLFELGVGAEGRLEGADWLDRELLMRARVASPRTTVGRFIARVDWLDQSNDTSNSLVTLGGHNGLRGYPSQAFFVPGGSRIRGNAELRTLPFVWHYLHVGGVFFYDLGDVYGREDALLLKHAVGIGLRGLLPQFNREVFRLDLGVPTDGSGFMVTLSGGTGQAVPLTAREDLQFDSSVGGLANQP